MTGYLQIPHYWAVYYHDGRSGHTMPRGFMIWFPDRTDDPRTSGNRRIAVRRSQVRKLTKSQYAHGLRMNRIRRQQGKPPFMILKRIVGPLPKHPFFDELNKGPFPEEARKYAEREFRRWVLPQIPTQTMKIKLRIG